MAMSKKVVEKAPEPVPETKRGGGYGQKILIGLVLIVAAFVLLWWGSPDRTGGEPPPAAVWGFCLLFALGFIIGSMGLMGAERDYPALVSGLVLYFIVGALVAVILYVSRNQLGMVTLGDVDSSAFWMYWLKVMALWPYELLARAGFMGYSLLDQL
jgi:hypothetical protein